MPRSSSHQVEHVTVHGHRRANVRAGSGPVVLLLHGLGCDHTTWGPVIDSLSRTHTVIAPDLLGHGSSDKPRADYSVGGYANGMRDLLTVLGIATPPPKLCPTTVAVSMPSTVSRSRIPLA